MVEQKPAFLVSNNNKRIAIPSVISSSITILLIQPVARVSSSLPEMPDLSKDVSACLLIYAIAVCPYSTYNIF